MRELDFPHGLRFGNSNSRTNKKKHRMIAVYEVLQCPLCRSDINKDLVCLRCGEKYALMDDVHIMVSQKLSSKEWRWDQSIFSDEKTTKTREEYRGYFNPEYALKVWHEG